MSAMYHLKNDFPFSQRVLCKLRCGRKLYSVVVRCNGIKNSPQHLSRSRAEAQLGRVTRVLSRAKRQCRGCFYRLTDCHPLKEDGGMACLSSSREHLAGVPGLAPRVESEGHFLPLVL